MTEDKSILYIPKNALEAYRQHIDGVLRQAEEENIHFNMTHIHSGSVTFYLDNPDHVEKASEVFSQRGIEHILLTASDLEGPVRVHPENMEGEDPMFQQAKLYQARMELSETYGILPVGFTIGGAPSIYEFAKKFHGSLFQKILEKKEIKSTLVDELIE